MITIFAYLSVIPFLAVAIWLTYYFLKFALLGFIGTLNLLSYLKTLLKIS